MNRAVSTTHGGTIGLKRSREELEADPSSRFKKWKKGTTLGAHAMLVGEKDGEYLPEHNPGSAVKQARARINKNQAKILEDKLLNSDLVPSPER